jgi:hypothetical protein
MAKILATPQVWQKPRSEGAAGTKLSLTVQEQANVRAGLRWLRLRLGTHTELAKALRIKRKTSEEYIARRPPGAVIAIRAARLAGISVEDLLAGRWPGGTCPNCGRS